MQESKATAQLLMLREEAEAREFIVSDLRRQVAELLGHKQEALSMRKQLKLVDERVKARDLAQQARLEELGAKVRLHETVEGQLEAQLLRLEEERLATQKEMRDAVELAERRAADAEARLAQTEGRVRLAAEGGGAGGLGARRGAARGGAARGAVGGGARARGGAARGRA